MDSKPKSYAAVAAAAPSTTDLSNSIPKGSGRAKGHAQKDLVNPDTKTVSMTVSSPMPSGSPPLVRDHVFVYAPPKPAVGTFVFDPNAAPEGDVILKDEYGSADILLSLYPRNEPSPASSSSNPPPPAPLPPVSLTAQLPPITVATAPTATMPSCLTIVTPIDPLAPISSPNPAIDVNLFMPEPMSPPYHPESYYDEKHGSTSTTRAPSPFPSRPSTPRKRKDSVVSTTTSRGLCSGDECDTHSSGVHRRTCSIARARFRQNTVCWCTGANGCEHVGKPILQRGSNGQRPLDIQEMKQVYDNAATSLWSSCIEMVDLLPIEGPTRNAPQKLGAECVLIPKDGRALLSADSSSEWICGACAHWKVGRYHPHGRYCDMHCPANVGVISVFAFRTRDGEFANPMLSHVAFFQATEDDDSTFWVATPRGKAVPKEQGLVNFMRAILSQDENGFVHFSVCTCGLKQPATLAYADCQLRNFAPSHRTRSFSYLVPTTGVNPWAPIILPQIIRLDAMSTLPMPRLLSDESIVFKCEYKAKKAAPAVMIAALGFVDRDGVPHITRFERSKMLGRFGDINWVLPSQIPKSKVIYTTTMAPGGKQTIVDAVDRLVPDLISTTVLTPICADYLRNACTVNDCPLRHMRLQGRCPHGSTKTCALYALSFGRERFCSRVHADENPGAIPAPVPTKVFSANAVTPATIVGPVPAGGAASQSSIDKALPPVAAEATDAINNEILAYNPEDMKASNDAGDPSDTVRVPFRLTASQLKIVADYCEFIPLSGNITRANPLAATIQWWIARSMKLPANSYIYGADPVWSQLHADMYCPVTDAREASWDDANYAARIGLMDIPHTYNCGLIVDVYDMPDGKMTTPIEAAHVAALVDRTKLKKIHWLRRNYNQVYGAHFNGAILYERDTRCVDMVVERDAHMLTMGARHSVPDWLSSEGEKIGDRWLSWINVPMGRDFVLTTFTLVDAAVFRPKMHSLSHDPTTRVDHDYWGPTQLPSGVAGYISATPCLKHMHLDVDSAWFVYGSYVFLGPKRSIKLIVPQELVNAISNSLLFRKVENTSLLNHYKAAASIAMTMRIPRETFTEVVVCCLIFALKAKLDLELTALRIVDNNLSRAVNNALSTNMAPKSVSLTSMFAMLSLGVVVASYASDADIGKLVRKKVKPASLFSAVRNSALVDVFIAPPMEEIFKRWAAERCPFGWAIVPIAEIWLHKMSAIQAGFHTLLHYSFFVLPIELGVLAHALYNFVVVSVPHEAPYGIASTTASLPLIGLLAVSVGLGVATLLASAFNPRAQGDSWRARASEFIYGTYRNPTWFRRLLGWVGCRVDLHRTIPEEVVTAEEKKQPDTATLLRTIRAGVLMKTASDPLAFQASLAGIADDEKIPVLDQYIQYNQNMECVPGYTVDFMLPVSSKRPVPDLKTPGKQIPFAPEQPPIDPNATVDFPLDMPRDEVSGVPIFRAVGVGVTNCVPSVPSNSDWDYVGSLAKRHVCAKPIQLSVGPDAEFVEAGSPEEHHWVKYNSARIYKALSESLHSSNPSATFPMPISIADFLKHCRPSVAKRLKASWHAGFWAVGMTMQDLRTICFGKIEVQVNPKILRLIQTRSDRYMMAVGPYYVPLVKQLSNIWRPFVGPNLPNHIFYFSGYDGATLGEWVVAVARVLFTKWRDSIMSDRVTVGERKIQIANAKAIDDIMLAKGDNSGRADALRKLDCMAGFASLPDAALVEKAKAYGPNIPPERTPDEKTDFSPSNILGLAENRFMSVVSCDCSSYDGHNRPDVITPTMRALQDKFAIPDSIINCTLHSLTAKGMCGKSGAVRFKTFGCTITGDHTTSVLNTTTNIAKYLAVLAEYPNIREDTYMVVVGDDALLIGPPALAKVDFVGGFAKFGDALKQASGPLYSADFCQMRPWPVDEEPYIVWGPKPFRRLCKLPYGVRTNLPPFEQLKLVVQGTHNDLYHVPIVGEVVEQFPVSTKAPPLLTSYYRKPLDRAYQRSALARLMFERVYKVDPDLLAGYIMAWKGYLANPGNYMRFIDNPAFHKCWIVDCEARDTSGVDVIDPYVWSRIAPRQFDSATDFFKLFAAFDDLDSEVDQLYVAHAFDVMDVVSETYPMALVDAIEASTEQYDSHRRADHPRVAELIDRQMVQNNIMRKYHNLSNGVFFCDPAYDLHVQLRLAHTMLYRKIRSNIVGLAAAISSFWGGRTLKPASLWAGLQTRPWSTIKPPTPLPTEQQPIHPICELQRYFKNHVCCKLRTPCCPPMPQVNLRRPTKKVEVKPVAPRQRRTRRRRQRQPMPPAPQTGQRAIAKAIQQEVAAESKVMVVPQRASRPARVRIHNNAVPSKLAGIQDNDMFKAYCWARGFYHPDFPPTRFPDRNPSPTMLSPTHMWRPTTPFVTQAVSGTIYNLVAFSPQLVGTLHWATAIGSDGAITWSAGTNHPLYSSLLGDIDKYRLARFQTRLFDLSPITSKQGSLLKTTYLDSSSGSNLPANVNDIYSLQSSTFMELADEKLPFKSSSAPLLTDDNANDMIYLGGSLSQPIIIYSLQVGTAGTQSIQWQVSTAIEGIPFGTAMQKYELKAVAGDPNKLGDVMNGLAARLDGPASTEATDWTWRGFAESVLAFGKWMWGPTKAVATALAPWSPAAGAVSIGMNAIDAATVTKHHHAIQATLLRLEAYQKAVEEGKAIPGEHTSPFSNYYAGLVGSPYAPNALRSARLQWALRNDGHAVSPSPDNLLDMELRAHVESYLARFPQSMHPIPRTHRLTDVSTTEFGILVVVDGPDGEYTVRLQRAGSGVPRELDYTHVEQDDPDDDAKSSVSRPDAARSTRTRSQPPR